MEETLLNKNDGYKLAKDVWGKNYEIFGNNLQCQKNMTDKKKDGLNAVSGGIMMKYNLYGYPVIQSMQLGNLGPYWLVPSVGDNERP